MKHFVVHGIILVVAIGASRTTSAASPAAVVTATGTVQPTEIVDVNASMSGKIQQLGTDPQDSAKTIDAGTKVKKGTVLAQFDSSIYEADVVRAKADLKLATARNDSASVEQCKAALQRAELNLDHCTIRSPIDGFIVSRRCSAGRTVDPSLNASSLFMIAGSKKVQI